MRGASGRGPDERALLRVESLRKSYGDKVVLDDVDLTVEPHDVVCLIGSSGSRQVHAAALPEPAGGHRRRRDRFEGQEISDPRVDRARGPQADRDGLPGLQPVPAPDRARQLHARAAPGARRAARRGGGPGARAARRGSGWPTRRTSTPTGSPAASSSGPPWSARWPPSPRCCCSTRSPRPSTPSWSARCSTIVRDLAERRHDDGAGHPRDGVRPRRRHQGLLPRRAAGSSSRARPREIFSGPREERTRQFLRRVPARPAAVTAATVMIACMSLRAGPGHRTAARRPGRRDRRDRARAARLHDPGRPRRRRDPGRAAGRPAADAAGRHDLLNRGRPSVALDLKHPEAVATVLEPGRGRRRAGRGDASRRRPSGSGSAPTSASRATRGWSTAG